MQSDNDVIARQIDSTSLSIVDNNRLCMPYHSGNVSRVDRDCVRQTMLLSLAATIDVAHTVFRCEKSARRSDSAKSIQHAHHFDDCLWRSVWTRWLTANETRLSCAVDANEIHLQQGGRCTCVDYSKSPPRSFTVVKPGLFIIHSICTSTTDNTEDDITSRLFGRLQTKMAWQYYMPSLNDNIYALSSVIIVQSIAGSRCRLGILQSCVYCTSHRCWRNNVIDPDGVKSYRPISYNTVHSSFDCTRLFSQHLYAVSKSGDCIIIEPIPLITETAVLIISIMRHLLLQSMYMGDLTVLD